MIYFFATIEAEIKLKPLGVSAYFYISSGVLKFVIKEFQQEVFMNLDYLAVALDGLVGVLLMFSVMWLITNSGLANCNMVGAIGSMLTPDRKRENLYGLAIYVAGGLFFTFVYNFMFEATNIESTNFTLVLSLFLGFIHGLIVSYAIIAVFSLGHRDDRFREVSIGIALAHLVAHVIFGFCLGFLFCLRTGILSPDLSYENSPFMVYAFFAVTSLPILMSIFSIDRKIRKPVRVRKN